MTQRIFFTSTLVNSKSRSLKNIIFKMILLLTVCSGWAEFYIYNEIPYENIIGHTDDKNVLIRTFLFNNYSAKSE